MNSVLEEMQELMHYGMPRRSGRYPWGSGEDPYQHGRDFLGRIEMLKKKGWSETPENIKEEFGLTTSEYRTEKRLAKNERRMLQVARVKSLTEDGLGPSEIGKIMGINESTVRSLMDTKSEQRMNSAKDIADQLKARIKEFDSEKGMLDVGAGVENEFGVSKETLDEALYRLKREGYEVYGGRFNQVTNAGQKTTQKVLCPPGTEHKEIYDLDRVHSVKEYSPKEGEHITDKFRYPESLDSKRLMIRYKDDIGADGFAGVEKDGVIEIRRGVKDLSLGDVHYAQVRILVDKTHYIKGMAVYSDDLPDGVDLVFNTNKTPDVGKLGALKKIKDDPDNPFGALIKPKGQSTYIDDDGTEKLSLINKTREERDWSDWKDALPSQFLAKQSQAMAKKQLDLAKADKLAEFDDICNLENPTIKKHLLKKFSDSCDSAAVHLQAAALPGQKYHVIVPINSLKDTEVYAPGYADGTKLALVRYPHGGIFEIPILTVNNKNALGRKVIGKEALDGIGITSKVAEQLSGADFDGDTVMCIPTHDRAGKVKIASSDPLDGLKGFDPKTSYGADKVVKDEDGKEHYYRNGKEYRIMSNTGTQMGVISNLITDMTIAGANEKELAAAVRHSMVVIDAEKHKLDYKQSEIDNNIAALHKEYQGKSTGGAATILSRAKGQASVVKRKGSPKVNMPGKPYYDPDKPEGALIWTDDPKATYTVTKKNKRTGEIITTTKTAMQKSTKMAEADDAMDLVSVYRHPMELIYADYANSMKSLANKARKEMMSSGKIEYDANAKVIYQKEVDSLNAKLNDALKNAPRERAAQRKANVEVESKKSANPNMKPGDIKKAGQQGLSKYRDAVGSVARRDRSIKIEDREWEAIQAGAVSETTLRKILANTDVSELRQRATPKTSTKLSAGKVATIKAMSNSNYTIGQIADKLGISKSAVSEYLKGEN